MAELSPSEAAAAAEAGENLPYTIAALCFLFDDQGRTLLLHRRRPPNQELYSPIGGKLERGDGESPRACARREIEEETSLVVEEDDLHLTGMVSETAYLGQGHWLMFLFELTRPVSVVAGEMDEGRLEWHDPANLETLPLPETDRRVLWPLFWKHRGGFFSAHIDCRGPEMTWRVNQSLSG
ncbi:MAG: NUDIX domain-containing protein [Phycisphaeraceae bacterium]|nr:NUDIX domain-containing protein [Phycisphaeraceae bacterium]